MDLIKNKFLQKYIFKYLTYGNWGFPGWSGGEWVIDPEKTNWDIKSKDEMDKLFKEHDFYYQHSKNFTNFADTNLIVGLAELKLKGVYKNCYKIVAIVVFCIKLILISLAKK